MKTQSPMELDDSADVGELIPAKDNDGVPYCTKHHCRMKQASGAKKGSPAYYKCPVDGCEEKEKLIQTRNPGVVPPQPQLCPRCNPEQVCERDTKSSTAASVILCCPNCGWKSNAMPVPQLAAAHFAARRRWKPGVPDVGDR